MWIFFNEHINDLKIPVVTTYLQAMWKLNRQGIPLRIDQLTKPNQKDTSLSRHLKMAANVGLIEKRRRVSYNGSTFVAAPNDYILRNPSLKVWVEYESIIDDSFSFALQTQLGKKQTAYYVKKYGDTTPKKVRIEELSETDRETLKRCETLEFRGIVACSYFNDEAWENEQKLKRSQS